MLTCMVSLGAMIVAEKIHQPIEIIGAFVTLRLAHNSGIAYSIMLPTVFQTTLIGIALLLVIMLALRTKKDSQDSVAFGLIIGGALGNLFDRMLDGFVTDFIAVGTFPIFNLADSFICIGVGLLVMKNLYSTREDKHGV